MKTLAKKLCSRKFLTAATTVIFGIIVALGGEDTLRMMTGTLTTLLSALTYIITEGKIDAAVKESAEAIKEAEAKEYTEKE